MEIADQIPDWIMDSLTMSDHAKHDIAGYRPSLARTPALISGHPTFIPLWVAIRKRIFL